MFYGLFSPSRSGFFSGTVSLLPRTLEPCAMRLCPWASALDEPGARSFVNVRCRGVAARRANHLEITMNRRKVALLSTESKKDFVRSRKALALGRKR